MPEPNYCPVCDEAFDVSEMETRNCPNFEKCGNILVSKTEPEE